MGMPSSAVRGTYVITHDTGDAGHEPSRIATLNQTHFEDVNLASLQQQVQADRAFMDAMASVESIILRALEGDDPGARDSSNHIGPNRDGVADGLHHNRGPELADTRKVALLLLATWLASPAPDDETEQGRGPVRNGSPENGTDSTRDVGTYSSSNTGPISKDYVPTSDGNETPGPGTNHLTFVPPPRNSRPEWFCLEIGLQYNQTTQPAGAVKKFPYACKKCENCIRYQIYAKAVKYVQSLPGPLQTILAFTALDPTAARTFASNRQHSRRLPGGRRYSQLSQEGVPEDMDGSNLPCDGYLLWDGEMDHNTLKMIERHAKDQGLYNVNAYVTEVDENKFQEWLPNRLRLVGRDGEKIDATHFVRGWAKETKPEKDGRARVKYVPIGGAPVTQCSQNERGQVISNSWRPHFGFQWDPTLTPDERKAERDRSIHLLHRARYVNYLDWLYCMSPRTLERTKLGIEMSLKGEKPNLKHWRTFANAPQELIEETAKWLMGKRDPEPAITLVAERLGFISMWRELHIAPDFLAELTDKLQPLLSVEGPRGVTRLKYHVDGEAKASNERHRGHSPHKEKSRTGDRKRSRNVFNTGTGTFWTDMAKQQRLPI